MAIIKLLKKCPDYAPILGFWTYKEWFRNRSIDFDLVIKSFQNRANDISLPISWVAIEDGMPVGMVSLKNQDLWSRKDIWPWLVSLYVLPEYRNRGIGSGLIKSVIDKSREIGFKALYLFVSDNRLNYLDNYYTNRGWKFVDNAVGNEGHNVKIFCYSI